MSRFDKAALTWDEKPLRVELAKNIAKGIVENIPIKSDMKVLDFGCGTGLLSFFILPYVKEVVGVDNSSKMVEVFNKKAEDNNIQNARAYVFDLEKENLNEDFDLIINSMVFHHIEDLERILKSLYSHLKGNGYIAIADLVKEDGSFHDDNDGVVHFGFDVESLKSLFEKVGFKDVESNIVHTVKKQKGDGEREYPIFLIVGKKE